MIFCLSKDREAIELVEDDLTEIIFKLIRTSDTYGWSDLELGHVFHETAKGVRFTISKLTRREVRSRLLQFKHERYEEEES